jgi:hypothetical protein
MVEVDESLLRLTPVGCWFFDVHAAVANANELGAGKFTAMNFLSFMLMLNRLFIQDAGAMHPEKIDHPLFRLEVFWSVEFSVSSLFLFLLLLLLYLLRTNLLFYLKRFKTEMQETLDDKNVMPLDAALE